jgi:predicted transport protein
MGWACPVCHKEFNRKNQSHSCNVASIESFFENKPESLKKLYEALLSEINKFGTVTLNPVQSGINLKAKTTFASIKPKKDYLMLEFLLEKKEDVFPVAKTFQISKNRFAHFVQLQNKTEIDEQLINWLKRAYGLTS